MKLGYKGKIKKNKDKQKTERKIPKTKENYK